MRLAAMIGALGAVIALALTFAVNIEQHRSYPVPRHRSHQSMVLPAKPDSYVGVYQAQAPDSYAG